MRALLCMLTLAGAATAQGLEVRTEVQDGDTFLTLRAEQVTVERVLEGVAAELDVTLGSLAGLDREALVDAFVVRRPLRSALNDVLLTVGLRARLDANGLSVSADLPPYLTAADLWQRSVIAHETLLREYGDSPSAEVFELRLAEACTELGPKHYTQAITSYKRIVEADPSSPEVPHALLESARLLTALGDWPQAALQYAAVLDLGPDRKGYAEQGLLGYARCMTEVAAAQKSEGARHEASTKAVMALDTLDLNHPTVLGPVRYERAVVRAHALSLSGEPLRAMKALDLAAASSPNGSDDRVLLALRAEAFTAAGRFGEASTAWMMHARSASTDAERVASWQHAADAALAGDFEVAAVLIHGVAEDAGLGDELIEQRNEAELRLELGGERVTSLNLNQVVDRGAHLLENNLVDEAIVTLRRAWLKRGSLDSLVQRDLAVLYARALDADGLETEAIGVLRTAIGDHETTTDRQVLYRAAADLYESRGHITAAIAALRGEL